MDKSTKTKIVAGVIGALLLAVAVGAAGDQLGIESSELSDALKQALKNQVDEAVEEGRLTEEQGQELKERIDSGETPFIFPGLGPRGDFDFDGPGHFGPRLAFGGLEAAATYLGLTEQRLHERLEDGDTLAEVARDEGKSVDGLVDAMAASAEERIDEAVEDGRLTAERANELRRELDERLTDLVNGELPAVPRGRPHFHFGPSGFEPPHPFDGPRA
jgi:polyhydroxyalkanoate synthesis regulator phasin